MRNLNVDVWLPHFWFFLYSVAHSYPDHPTKIIKRKYYDFVQNLPLYFPHATIRNQFSHILDAFPVTPYLDNQDSFTYWVHFIHNKLHKELGLTEDSYMNHLDHFYDHFKPKPIRLSENVRIRKKFLVFGVIIGCLGLIYYHQ